MKGFFSISVLFALLVGCGGSSDGNSDTSEPQNRAPIASAGGNQSTYLGQTVTLDGTASSDADSDALTYNWVVTSSPASANPKIAAADQATTSFSADVPGSYAIQLTVSDGKLSDSESVNVSLIDPDSAVPIANAGNGYSAPEGVDILLDGSASSAPTDGNLTYSWNIKSGPTTSTAMLLNADSVSPTLQSTSIGRYEIELVVTMENGNFAIDTASVLVVDYLPIMNKLDHYTQILPADDTRIIYVSSQEGDDANDGFSSKTPVQSIQRGISLLRDGFPDWLALKSCDSWNTGIGGWGKSGRSPSEPMVITSYGAGDDRPLLRTIDQTAFRFQGGGGSPEYVNYLVIHGLHFYAASRDPQSLDFKGVSSDRAIVWLRGTKGLLIEDNMIQFYKEAISLQETDGFDISNVLIKNNVIVDSYNLSGDHAQGIYLDATDHVRIERNVFDHIGWNDGIDGAEKTKFNHSIYVQTNNRDIEIIDNIIMRSSSHGVQLRSGGLIEGNVLVGNAISLMLGGDEARGNPGFIRGNIILHGSDISDAEPRGWGIDLTSGIVSAEVSDNIIAHEDSVAPDPVAIREHSLSSESGNAVFNWGSQSQSADKFLNPSLTVLDFDKQAGGSGTMESFVENVRMLSSRSNNQNYSVERIKLYFQNAYSASR